MAKPEQIQWMERVFGVSFGTDTPDEDEDRPPLSAPSRPLLPIWVAAKEALDSDIDKLQRALREDGDEGLLQIAEYGLHKVTNGQSVKLMAALREADSAKTDKAVTAAYDAVQSFRNFLASSPGVDVIEDNPLDVNVPVRAKLGAALDQLARAMQG